jgi:hypothetical protein
VGTKNQIMKWKKNNFQNFNDSGWVKKKKTKVWNSKRRWRE